MNLKKKFTMAIMAAMTLMLLSTSAKADTAWYNDCTLNSIGAGTGFYWVSFTDNSATPAWTGSKWFQFPPSYANQFLAVGLSARSIGCTVRIVADLDSGSVPYVYAIYLNQ